MGSIEQAVRQRLVELRLEDVVEFVNRELIPVLVAMRDEINRVGGNVYTTEEAEYKVPRDAKLVLSKATIATFTFPDPTDMVGAIIWVVQDNATGQLDVTTAAGGQMTGLGNDTVSLISITNGPEAFQFMSDGTYWRALGGKRPA